MTDTTIQRPSRGGAARDRQVRSGVRPGGGRTVPLREAQRGRPTGSQQLRSRPVAAPPDRMADRSQARAGSPVARAVPRVPFVLLVLGLLGGSLVCLLVINTTLGAASFRISQLQNKSARLATEEQNLRQQVAAEQAPAAIAQRAYALGMRAQTGTTILDLRSGQIYRLPGQGGVGVELGAPPAPPATIAPGTASKPSATPAPGAGTTPAAPRPTVSPAPSVTSSPVPARSSA